MACQMADAARAVEIFLTAEYVPGKVRCGDGTVLGPQLWMSSYFFSKWFSACFSFSSLLCMSLFPASVSFRIYVYVDEQVYRLML